VRMRSLLSNGIFSLAPMELSLSSGGEKRTVGIVCHPNPILPKAQMTALLAQGILGKGRRFHASVAVQGNPNQAGSIPEAPIANCPKGMGIVKRAQGKRERYFLPLCQFSCFCLIEKKDSAVFFIGRNINVLHTVFLRWILSVVFRTFCDEIRLSEGVFP